nr:hypothetical protein CFP56_09582 [Quercus suber]
MWRPLALNVLGDNPPTSRTALSRCGIHSLSRNSFFSVSVFTDPCPFVGFILWVFQRELFTRNDGKLDDIAVTEDITHHKQATPRPSTFASIFNVYRGVADARTGLFVWIQRHDSPPMCALRGCGGVVLAQYDLANSAMDAIRTDQYTTLMCRPVGEVQDYRTIALAVDADQLFGSMHAVGRHISEQLPEKMSTLNNSSTVVQIKHLPPCFVALRDPKSRAFHLNAPGSFQAFSCESPDQIHSRCGIPSDAEGNAFFTKLRSTFEDVDIKLVMREQGS